MSFWRTVKRGFGYGLGGSIGWNLGNLIWRWIARLVGLIVLAVGAGWGLPMVGNSVGKYNELKHKYEQQAKQKQHQAKQEADHAGKH